MVMWLGGGRRVCVCVCKSSCMQNKGAGGWLLVLEENLVNGRFPFARLRLHSFCPALELTSVYLHCNQKVNHTEPGSRRARTTPRSVAKWEKVEDLGFPAQPRFSDTLFTLGSQRDALSVYYGERRGKLAFA